MAVREVGVGGQRPLVALDRGGGAAGVLQQAPQVEVRDGVVRRVADGRLVVRLRRSALAGGVEEAPEVDVRVGQRRIEGQGLLVGVTRLGRRGGLELAAQIEPLLGGPRGRLGRRGGRARRGRRGGRRSERGGIEAEEKLAGVRLPARGAVPRDHPAAVGVHADAREHLVARELAPQRGEQPPDAPGRHLRVEEPARGLEEQEVLEGPAQTAMRVAGGGELRGARAGAEL